MVQKSSNLCYFTHFSEVQLTELNTICSLVHITKHPTCLDRTGNTQNQGVCPWPYSQGKAWEKSRWPQWGTVLVAAHNIQVLTFLNSANADPKAGFTWVLSLIHWGSLLKMAGRVYLWSRSRMLAKSFWWRMALPVQRIKQRMAQSSVCSQARTLMFPSSVVRLMGNASFFLPSSFSVSCIPQPVQGRMNYLLTGLLPSCTGFQSALCSVPGQQLWAGKEK